MKKFFFLGMVMVVAVIAAGCDGSSSSPVFVAEILSDQAADGDIAYDPVQDFFTITNGPATIFFGLDESAPNIPEYRAFLSFPLDGITGMDVVPGDAVIVSAALELFINQVSFAGTVPTLIDLVEFPIDGLTPFDYDSPPLTFLNGNDASLPVDFFARDEGNFVIIDVTPLMREVQRRGLADFQVRFLLDFVQGALGLVGIEDRPRFSDTAPLLRVRYR